MTGNIRGGCKMCGSLCGHCTQTQYPMQMAKISVTDRWDPLFLWPRSHCALAICILIELSLANTSHFVLCHSKNSKHDKTRIILYHYHL